MRFSRNFFFAFAGATGLIAGMGAAAIYLYTPIKLRIAVGPLDSPDARIIQAVSRILEKDRRSIRLSIVATSGLAESLHKLRAKEVDLGILRADAGWLDEGGVVVNMRTNAVIAAAAGSKKLNSITDLKNRNVGIVARSSQDEVSILTLMLAFGLKSDDFNRSIVKPDEILAQTKAGKLDAIIAIGVPSDPEIADIVASVYGTKSSKPTILSVDVGDFVNKTNAVASAVTIPKNAFTRLQIPSEDVQSIGAPTMLVANQIRTGPIRQKAYRDGVAALTRVMLESHNQIGRTIPLANLISAPQTDKDVRFPIHPGANAYLNDELTSWSDLFFDQIWNIMLIAGLASSAVTTFIGLLRKDEPDPLAVIIERIAAVNTEATSTLSGDARTALFHKVNKIGADLAEVAYREQFTYERLAPVLIAMQNTRHTLEQRGEFPHE